MLELAGAGILRIACQRAIHKNAIYAEMESSIEIADSFHAQPIVSAERCQDWGLEHFGINTFEESAAVMIHRTASLEEECHVVSFQEAINV